MPRVMTVDKNPAYTIAIRELKMKRSCLKVLKLNKLIILIML